MPSASPLPSPSPSSSSLLGHHNNHENENDHHHLQQLPSKYWKALMRQLHQPSAEGTLLLLLDTILLIIFLIGVWGAAQSLGGLHDFACRDVESYVYLITFGLGLYLAQNALHRLQRLLLIAVWNQTYHNPHKEGSSLKSSFLSSSFSSPPARQCDRVAAEDVIAHVRGLQRLEVLRNHASPGLPMLFLFSWLYAGAVDIHTGCSSKYPALATAFHLFSWMGYAVALVCVFVLVFQCFCLSSAVSTPPTTTASSSSSSSRNDSHQNLFFCSIFPALLSASTSSACLVPLRRALTVVLGPLSLLLPTDLIPPGEGEEEGAGGQTGTGGAAGIPASIAFPLSAFASSSAGHEDDEEEEDEATVVEESISDFEYLQHQQHQQQQQRRQQQQQAGSGGHQHGYSYGSNTATGVWRLSPGILQSALETSPFGLSRRTGGNINHSNSSSRSTFSSSFWNAASSSPPLPPTTEDERPHQLAPPSSSSFSATAGLGDAAPPGIGSNSSSGSNNSSSSPESTLQHHHHHHHHHRRRRRPSPHRRRKPRRFFSISCKQLLWGTMWACLHLAILLLVGVSFYMLGYTSDLPLQEMEACASVRGYLFTIGTGFAAYLSLAVWLWMEKDTSMREDPHEHALKSLWLLRALVCLLSIGFVWGVIVMQEAPCFKVHPRLMEAVMAFILLGSSLLAIALTLHGIATVVWSLNSLSKVVVGVCETMALFVSLLLRLPPHQDLFSKGSSKNYVGSAAAANSDSSCSASFSSSTSRSTSIQIAEELPLLPFFNIRVLESPATHQQDERRRRGRGEDEGGVELHAGAALPASSSRSSDESYLRGLATHSGGEGGGGGGGERQGWWNSAPAMPSTPVGRPYQTPPRRGGRSRLAYREDDDESEEEEEKEEARVNDAMLPAAVPVSRSSFEEEEDDEGFGTGGYNRTGTPPPPLLTAATLDSLFDVTPLSLTPIRRRPPALSITTPAAAAAAAPPPLGEGQLPGTAHSYHHHHGWSLTTTTTTAAAGGGFGGSSNNTVHTAGGGRPQQQQPQPSSNTCCPLPPPPPPSSLSPPASPTSVSATVLSPHRPIWASYV